VRDSLTLAALQAFYLHAPLFVAAAAAALVLKRDLLRALKRPIDGGVTVRGRRLFGDTKTWRVAVASIAGATLGVCAQRWLLGGRLDAYALVDYARTSPLAVGAAIGGGAMLGELPNSFVKRQLGIPPSGTARGPIAGLFYVWDQVDFLTATWPLCYLFARPTWRHIVVSFALALILHPLLALLGFLIGSRKTVR
jgi:hypothetical protein